MVGRKSRRAYDYGHVTPLIRAGSEPFRGWRLYVNIRREPAMFHFGETMPRTRSRHGSNPPRSSCVDYLQSYCAEIFALPFCASCAFCGYSRFLAILSFFWQLSLSLPYLSAPGLKPWTILYSRFRLRPPPPLASSDKSRQSSQPLPVSTLSRFAILSRSGLVYCEPKICTIYRGRRIMINRPEATSTLIAR
jgi:hypothetical protein